MNINIGGQLAKLLMGGQPGVPAPEDASGILGELERQRLAPKMPGVSKVGPYGLMRPGNPVPPTAARITPPRPQVQQDPLQEIMRQLTELMGERPPDIKFAPVKLPEFNPTQFKGQATQIVNEQFNPVIESLLNQQKQTQTRAQGNQQAVGQMYQQLASYLGQEAATTNKSYDAAQAQAKNAYTDERDRMAAMYAADAANQRKEAQRLGTEAFGTNEAIAAQNADKQFAQEIGGQQQLASQNAFEQQQVAQQDYDRAMQGAARAEGGEAQQDIIRQLEDYMSESDANLASTRSQAAGSISDLMMKLAQGTYDRDVANAQFGYQQQRDYIGDQNQLYDRELNMKLKQLELMQAATGEGQSGSEKLNPWQSVAQFSEQLAPGQGQDFVAALQKGMAQRQEISGINPLDASGQPVKMNPALFAQLIGDSQAAGGLDRNKLMMAAQELYRLLYGL